MFSFLNIKEQSYNSFSILFNHIVKIQSTFK